MAGFLPEAEYWLALLGEAHLGQADALLLVHLYHQNNNDKVDLVWNGWKEIDTFKTKKHPFHDKVTADLMFERLASSYPLKWPNVLILNHHHRQGVELPNK